MDYSSPISIPRLSTSRLLLREYRAADFNAFAEHLDGETPRKMFGPTPRGDAWRIFGCQTGTWMLDGAGWWSIELRETGALVGNIGGFFREGNPDMELGWNVYGTFGGKGYATEAATEVVRYAFEERKEKRVIAFVDPWNQPSLGVARNLGLTYECDTTIGNDVVGRYGRTRE